MSQSQRPSVPPEWQTYAEKTEYRETPRYGETIDYSKRLDAASPLIQFQSFGRSGEGRELPLLIAAEGETFTPERARKPVKRSFSSRPAYTLASQMEKTRAWHCCATLP